MRQFNILDDMPFDTIVDYLCLSAARVKQLLAQGQVYNCPLEGLIITLERYSDREVIVGE